jgi:ketosteroid isomerase-like protein
MTPPPDFREMLDRTQSALSHLVDGDAQPYLTLWSHAGDVTVMGGFGSYETGWDRVRQNTEFAASRFRGGQISSVEEMAAGVSGDLGYAVWIERGDVTVEGRDEAGPLAVRATHVFRLEDGAWKIIHRHGDPITQITQAAEVLQR